MWVGCQWVDQMQIRVPIDDAHTWKLFYTLHHPEGGTWERQSRPVVYEFPWRREEGADPLGTVRIPHEIIELPCEKDKFGAGTAFTDQWINGGSMRYAPIREELLALHRSAAAAREKAAA